MQVLIFHGYLLHGTGSNVYNASLAQALASQGHDVHLICQDRRADELDWVRGNDNVTVHIPNIGGLLPVFVADRYEGFEVKTFPELTDEELDHYLDANVDAVRQVVEQYGEPDAALANHLIMGPVILARAGVRYAIKVHGSDLSYVVRPHPERFVPYALEGTEAAAGILAGSSHTAQVLYETVPDPTIPERTRLGPPGVDVHRFRPHDEAEALRNLERLAARLESVKPQAGEARDSFGRDAPSIASALRGWGEGDPRVLFVGKFLVSKGVDLLAAAWPLVHRRSVEAGGSSPRLLFVGFGAFEPGLRALVEALGRGDLEAGLEVARRGRGFEGEEDVALPILHGFLGDPPEGYADAAREAAGSVLVGGRLAHDEVADVMPAADTFAMTSTWPEAFGMVPAESAACGVPPVSADHSGMREVSQLLAEALDPELVPLLSFEIGPDAVRELAERISGWLALEPERRRGAGLGLAKRVDELWSWEGVARTVIAASRGELEGLPEVVT
ncbi:MAG TPA: glycosyltransferase family 4 protein [Solirubrobacterales bacterium]|nr:glycosyltransferase family 4 protein [Solirubrobacterales bacterium]